MDDGRRIKSARRFPGCALWGKDGLVRGPLPGAERQIDSRRGEGKGRYEGEQDQREKGKERFLLAKTARRGSGLASLEMTRRGVATTNDHKDSLLRLRKFGRIELLGADDAFAFFDDDVEIAVIVEVAEGTSARGDGNGDARAAVVRNVSEVAVAEIFVEQLALRVAGFGLELLDFGIDMAVAD